MNLDNLGPLVGDDMSRSQRSLSASSSSSHELIETTISSSYDKVFPLIDEMTRVAPMNTYLATLAMIIITLQIFFCGTFCFGIGEWNENDSVTKLIKGVLCIADFGIKYDSVFDAKAVQIILIILDFATMAIFGALIMSYDITKTFQKSEIVLFRIFLSFINPILLIPTFFSFSYELNELFDNEVSTTHLILTLLLGIALGFSSMNFYIDTIFRSSTCYLENTPFVQWDGSTFLLIVFTTGLSVFCSRLLIYFRKWSFYVLIACFCLACAFFILRLYYFPFIKVKMNSVYVALEAQLFISAIISVIDFNTVAKLILSIIPFFLFYIAARLYEVKIRMKILEKEDLTTPGKILRILRLTIQDLPEEFVSWKYIKDATTTQNQSSTVFVRVAQLLSFFPSESQLLNHFVSIIGKHSDLSFSERFLFYQIKRIHILRQSSATRQSNFDFAEVEKATNKMIQSISGFFLRALDNNQELSIDALTGICRADQITSGICMEALDKYPNSSRLTYEYSRYLIECKADFRGGAQQFFKAEAMDRGNSIAIDYAFRSMVNLFPVFLKHGILDYRGRNVLSRKNGKGSSSSASSATSGINADEQWEDINEEQSSRVFAKPKLRFALRRAIDNMRSRYLIAMQITTVIKTVAVIVVAIILLVSSKYIFQSRTNTCSLIASLSQIYESYVVGLLAVARLWADKLDISPSNDLVNETLGFSQTDETPLFNIDLNTLSLMKQSIADGFLSLENLGNNLATLAKSDEELVQISLPFISEGSITYCNDSGVPIGTIEMSQRSAITYLFTQMLTVENLQRSDADSWVNSRQMCEVCANLAATIQSVDSQIQSYVDREESTYKRENKILLYVAICLPIVILLALDIPITVFFFLFLNEVKDFFTNIMITPKETFVEASKPISLKSDQEGDVGVSSVESISSPKIAFPIVTFISSLVTTAMFLWLFIYYISTNEKYKKLSEWSQTSARRLPAVIQSLGITYTAAIFNNTGDTSYGTLSTSLAYMKTSITQAIDAHHNLTVSSDDYTAINKFSDTLDSLTYDFSCETEVGETGLHANYNCLSTDMLIMTFAKLSQDILISMQKSEEANILNSTTFIHFQHLICYHLLPKLQEIHDEIVDNASVLIDNLNFWAMVAMVLVLVGIAIFAPIEVALEHALQRSFDVFKVLIARFPPSHVIQNQGLLDLIVGKTKSTRVQQLSSSHAVINSSPDAVFALSSDFTIELMNPAASTIFGYTPEQLLGQSLVTLIPTNVNINNSSGSSGNEKDPNSKIYSQAQLMKANQAAMTYSCQVNGVKDDGTEVSLKVTLLGINHGTSFALICNDQTIMLKQQKQVEEAKKSAEKLLNQILPPMIVKKMNAGETDISFTVQSSTIIFIDIARFSDYTATLSATQIMQNLGRIFKAYDDLIPKYTTLLKIKLIGDDYMAAAGLFNPDVTPDVHATDVINFALDCLRALEEANDALEASLNVRIGVNTGGPLIAGVLGIDKPLFDIIGDPINVAARLQSTDIENHIQISQQTFELIKDKGYKVHERGKIFLKGKGEQTTYIIDPPESNKLTILHHTLNAAQQKEQAKPKPTIQPKPKQQQQMKFGDKSGEGSDASISVSVDTN